MAALSGSPPWRRGRLRSRAARRRTGEREDARTSAKSAFARELVARAQSELRIDPLRSIGLAVEAANLEPTPAAEDALRTALIDSKVRKILPAGRRMRVNAAAYSPDGSLVVTASGTGPLESSVCETAPGSLCYVMGGA